MIDSQLTMIDNQSEIIDCNERSQLLIEITENPNLLKFREKPLIIINYSYRVAQLFSHIVKLKKRESISLSI